MMPTEQPAAAEDQQLDSLNPGAPDEWIMALSADDYEALLAGYDELIDCDPDSPLAGFLQAWVTIERGKQSLRELFA